MSNQPPWIKKNNGGPNSPQGKEISSRNATKHGCCSNATLILPTENIQDFKSLEQTWLTAYDTRDEAETHLIEQVIQADWFLQRSTRTLAEVEAEYFSLVPNPANWTTEQHHNLARFLRYQTARANTVIKLRKAVEDYRKNRAAEIKNIQDAAQKAEKHAIFVEKYKQADFDNVDWDKEIEKVRRNSEALALGLPKIYK